MTVTEAGPGHPVPYLVRATAAGAARLCVRHGVSADAVSWAGVFAAGAGGLCFLGAGTWPVLLLVAPVFLYLRLWLNMLDGTVARVAGTASPRGAVVNELADSLADVLVFAGVAHSGLCMPATAWWAAVMALLTAQVGVLGQVTGGRREFGGLMSKPWRMVCCHAGAWTTIGLIWAGRGGAAWGGWTVLDWTCVVIALGCVQTAVARFARIRRRTAPNERAGHEG